jgi:PDZ domain-containing protein
MTSSQENATVAALTELGYKVPATLTVGGVGKGTGSDGVVHVGDVLTSINGRVLVTYQDLTEAMDAVMPGATVAVGVARKGKQTDLRIVTRKGADGRAMLGVAMDPKFDYPVSVSIKINDIGGPSAGMMFALGIIDRMTPQDEAGGKDVAGTGTMSIGGDVGPIGGIQQKMYGARRDGAAWFLAPAGNCDEVAGHVPAGLHVAKVATLHEARLALAAIGEGKGATVPTCRAGR